MFLAQRPLCKNRYSFSGFTKIALCAVVLGAALGLSRTASAMVVTCGGGGVVVVTPDVLDATLFGVVANCNGSRFDGTAQKIDTGTPSDLLVRGIWTRTAPRAVGEVTDTLTFMRDDYTLPNSKTATAWHELHGFMSLPSDPVNALAELSVNGVLDKTFTPGVSTGLLGHGVSFDLISEFTHDIPDGPLWKRAATYSWKFNAFTDIGDRIVFNATGHNYWKAVPEPSALSLFGLGIAGVCAMQWRKKRLAA
ncbi:MAG TPA: hypothetical protein DCO82_02935 [Alphaproteobacteria bacterium]|jgi:hypothetical protein|nr:hypothetical protein [Alphaproteobacteria bacterium]